jgi:serine/threonine-protein kinase HipA
MHQMSICGKFDDITKADLLFFAKENNIKDAQKLTDEVLDTVSSWPKLAQECGVPSEMIHRIIPNILQKM